MSSEPGSERTINALRALGLLLGLVLFFDAGRQIGLKFFRAPTDHAFSMVLFLAVTGSYIYFFAGVRVLSMLISIVGIMLVADAFIINAYIQRFMHPSPKAGLGSAIAAYLSFYIAFMLIAGSQFVALVIRLQAWFETRFMKKAAPPADRGPPHSP